MDYADIRNEITTGSLVGRLDDEGTGWVGVALRGEDVFAAYGPRIGGYAEMAGRVMVVTVPAGPVDRPGVMLLSDAVRLHPPLLVRTVGDVPAAEAVDGLLAAVAQYFNVMDGLAEMLLTPTVDFFPVHGGDLATRIWQAMGHMLPEPHGPAPDQMAARHLLDPLWGPPQLMDIELGDPEPVY